MPPLPQSSDNGRLPTPERPFPMSPTSCFDVVVVGAGAAGLFCAGVAGQALTINLNPQQDLAAALKEAKSGSRKQLSTAWGLALGEAAPQRLAQAWLAEVARQHPALQPQAALAELKDRDLDALGQAANAWQLVPSGTEGYAKAEVTAGGVDTRELHQQSMESKLVPGLHFIGEVVDITGWLGGYNFQWAWASAMACARALQSAPAAAQPATV